MLRFWILLLHFLLFLSQGQMHISLSMHPPACNKIIPDLLPALLLVLEVQQAVREKGVTVEKLRFEERDAARCIAEDGRACFYVAFHPEAQGGI